MLAPRKPYIISNMNSYTDINSVSNYISQKSPNSQFFEGGGLQNEIWKIYRMVKNKSYFLLYCRIWIIGYGDMVTSYVSQSIGKMEVEPAPVVGLLCKLGVSVGWIGYRSWDRGNRSIVFEFAAGPRLV